MFLQLRHQKLDIYSISLSLVKECYRITGHFPSEEKFSLVQQIRRSALSVHLNIAEGAARRTPVERKRFYEMSRSSLVEVDAAFDVSRELGFIDHKDLNKLNIGMVNCFKTLTGLIASSKE